MTQFADQELAEKVKYGDDEQALLELVNRHEAMFYNVVHKYSSVFQESGVYKPDVLNDRDFIFYKTAKSFDPSRKSKFSTWLGNYTRYECLNRITDNFKYESCDPAGLEGIVNSRRENPENKEQAIEDCLDALKDLKDKRVYQIFKMRYFSGSRKPPTWKAIAKKISVSTQTALNIHNRAMSFIRKKISSST